MKRNFKTLMSNWANDSHHLINNSALISEWIIVFYHKMVNPLGGRPDFPNRLRLLFHILVNKSTVTKTLTNKV
ncbi:hypothetical protein T11_6465 [Trichinella zimbabwensis]|uniref:Uncharacterized protein n=1 Tax=Trichinella zimbabwensis TaxID=268475 RepID=A0A0V1HPK2_9BILA|nr:hypothetical protein T11_6465 [Trichinella zimbabwensis]